MQQGKEEGSAMQIERLAWAGIKIMVGDTIIVVDALGHPTPSEPVMGIARERVIAVANEGSVDAALVTHIHPDHYDPATLRRSLVPDAPVLCPTAMREKVVEDRLSPTIMEPGDNFEVGGVEVAAVRAVDGLGDEQVSWILASGGRRIFHGGDTLWHGYWWGIAEQHGPFDLAFLPINGALVAYPTPTGIPAALTPEQAVAAGQVLGADVVVPIHYRTFHFPPNYEEYPEAEKTFRDTAAERGVSVRVLDQGETIDFG